MSQPKVYYLRRDVVSHVKPGRVYGKAGTEVTILYDHLDMMIVQDSSGNIFHSRTDNLSETPPAEVEQQEPQPAVTEKTHSRRPAKKKAAKPIQSNLF